MWTHSHDESNNHFSEICETHNAIQFFLFCKTFKKHVLTITCVEAAVLENDVTLVVNIYNVVAPIPGCCKSDLT